MYISPKTAIQLLENELKRKPPHLLLIVMTFALACHKQETEPLDPDDLNTITRLRAEATAAISKACAEIEERRKQAEEVRQRLVELRSKAITNNELALAHYRETLRVQAELQRKAFRNEMIVLSLSVLLGGLLSWWLFSVFS